MSSTAIFEQHRDVLFGVAYRMLGHVADAHDVVQDTWLRWAADDHSDVVDPRAYLVRITSRLALNRLRALANQRESYVGPWLPEPLVTAGALPDEKVELAESVSMAMLVVLETLSPLERAVFVLREVFDFGHNEIAAMLDRTETGVRQTARRARAHVRARRPRYRVDPTVSQETVDRFLTACTTGDIQGLLQVLAPDVTLWTDGGGIVRAARRPIRGADNVAHFLAAITPGTAVGALEITEINARPGVIASEPGAPLGAVSVDISGGRIVAIRMVVNPEKLKHLQSSELRSSGRGDPPAGSSDV